MSKNILSLSLAVILSLSFLSACTKDSDSPKAPNVVRGEVREERHEDEEAGRGNWNDDAPKSQATPQPVAPTQDATSVQVQTQAQVQVQAQKPATTPVTPASQARTVTKTVSYEVPEGTTSSTFTVSIAADGTISSVSSAMASGEKDSVVFNRIFAVSISDQVVGKKPADVASLSAVGGASLTTGAFKSFVANM